jgi:hypothetical protein
MTDMRHSLSYPFLALSLRTGVPYGVVLLCADALQKDLDVKPDGSVIHALHTENEKRALRECPDEVYWDEIMPETSRWVKISSGKLELRRDGSTPEDIVIRREKPLIFIEATISTGKTHSFVGVLRADNAAPGVGVEEAWRSMAAMLARYVSADSNCVVELLRSWPTCPRGWDLSDGVLEWGR